MKGRAHPIQRLGIVGFDGGNTKRLCLYDQPTELGVNSRFLCIMISKKMYRTLPKHGEEECETHVIVKIFLTCLPLKYPARKLLYSKLFRNSDITYMLQYITNRPHIEKKLNTKETVDLAGGQKKI
jgi:hypothetical protein